MIQYEGQMQQITPEDSRRQVVSIFVLQKVRLKSKYCCPGTTPPSSSGSGGGLSAGSVMLIL